MGHFWSNYQNSPKLAQLSILMSKTKKSITAPVKSISNWMKKNFQNWPITLAYWTSWKFQYFLDLGLSEFGTDLNHAVIDFFVLLVKIYNCAKFGVIRWVDSKCPLKCIEKFDLLTPITFEPMAVWKCCASLFTFMVPRTCQKSLDSKLDFGLVAIWLLMGKSALSRGVPKEN